jgi:hypothetical protein
MLRGDDRDGFGDSDLLDPEYSERIYIVHDDDSITCFPLDNVTTMTKTNDSLSIVIGNNNFIVRNKNTDIESVWYSWLVYCQGTIPNPMVF